MIELEKYIRDFAEANKNEMRISEQEYYLSEKLVAKLIADLLMKLDMAEDPEVDLKVRNIIGQCLIISGQKLKKVYWVVQKFGKAPVIHCSEVINEDNDCYLLMGKGPGGGHLTSKTDVFDTPKQALEAEQKKQKARITAARDNLDTAIEDGETLAVYIQEIDEEKGVTDEASEK